LLAKVRKQMEIGFSKTFQKLSSIFKRLLLLSKRKFVNIKLISIGKTDQKELEVLINEYQKRLSFYVKFELTLIPDLKNRKVLSIEQQKNQEGEFLLKSFQEADFVVLLDEKGTEFTSIKFSQYLSKKMLSGLKNLVFVIGGPYGFSKEVYNRANQKISLSKMTFSHQMIRLFFVEQVYRAFTILSNEPYHHE
jgi:23S rRNA (pseudouridine1915-N3)-methyltransferase